MPTSTTNYGLIKPGTDDPILIEQLNDNADVIDATLKSLSDAIDTAKLGIKYKGEVNYYSNLPASGNEIGDAYTVKYAGSSGTTPDGTEYVWGAVSGTNQWINFSKDSYTKAEVDALLALKVDTAGTGLSKSGTTLNHSNSTTAKTTQGFAQIAYDAQGHITGSTAATTAQANAINSGIDSTKVEQIETNKNNISTDEAALVELVDGGAKNIFIVGFTSKAATSALPAITNNGDGTVTANGVRTSSESGIWLYDMQENVNNTVDTRHTLSVGEYVLAPTGNSKIAIAIYKHDGVNSVSMGSASVNPLIFTYSAADKTQYPYLTYRLICGGNADFDNYTFKPMICTKSAWDISQAYVPYRPSYQELYEMVKALQANQ